MPRWTDLAPRQEHTPNQVAGGMRGHRGVVIHIAEGTFEGTIAWQQNPAAQVSSHFIVDLDGTICQMVDTADRAWCQAAGNDLWLSIENAGWSGQPLTSAQVAACGRILARVHAVHGVPLALAADPLGMGLGHHSMGGTAWGGHPDCPGDPVIGQKAAILACAQPQPTPPPTPAPLEEDPMLFEVAKATALHRDGSWADPSNATVLPLFEVGQGVGQWGDAWVRLASTGPAAVRVVTNGGGWNGTTVTLGFADGGRMVPLPPGTTVAYVGRVEGDPLTADVTGTVRYAPKP